MWHVDVGLALAWFIPILLGVLVGFVLLRRNGDGSSSGTARAEHRDAGGDMLHGT